LSKSAGSFRAPLHSELRTFYNCGTYSVLKGSRSYIDSSYHFVEKIKISGLYFVLFGLSLAAIPFWLLKKTHKIFFQMNYNPMGYKFYLAFMNSELDYFKFYKILPEKKFMPY
jgi:hypothetical protein